MHRPQHPPIVGRKNQTALGHHLAYFLFPRWLWKWACLNQPRACHGDAHGWLQLLGNHVKYVVTIDINRKVNEIIMKVWELCSSPASTRIRSSQPAAIPTQIIKLSRLSESVETIFSGEFLDKETGISQERNGIHLEFQKVMGRPPANGDERDFVIDSHRLKKFAEKIWEAQMVRT